MTAYEESLSAQESLDVITAAINRTKENIRDNYFPFLLWGWLIAIASFSFFLLKYYTNSRYFFIPFPLLSIAGIIITIVWYSRKRAGVVTESYLNYYLNRMWLVLGVCFIAVVFINVSQNLAPFTYTLILAAIGTLVSGLTMKFRPLVIGGVVFLLSGLVSIYVPDVFKALLHGVAILAGYVIPGYLLKNEKGNGRTV
jgi:hypothetical protein